MASGDKPARRSAVESFGCPKRFNAIQNLGVEDSGDETIRGRGFHAAAKTYILLLVNAQVESDADLARQALTIGLTYCPVPDHIVSQVERLFYRWAEDFELDLDAFLTAEERVVSTSREPDKAEGLADPAREFTADLVYMRPGELEVVDFKTYFRALTEEQARAELQPRWYLIEAKKQWPNVPRYRFTLVFVRIGIKVSMVFTPEDIEAMEPGVEAQIAAMTRAQALGDFPALPGSHCSLCRIACEVADDPHRDKVRITNTRDALQAFGDLLRIDKHRRALRRALSGFCQLEGAIALNGQVLGHQQGESVRYPAIEALDVMDRFGVQTAAATISRSGLGVKRLAPSPAEALDLIAIKKPRAVLRHKKAGEYLPDGLIDVLADIIDESDEDEPS